MAGENGVSGRLTPSLEDMRDMAVDLANMAKADGYAPDRLLVVQRGGALVCDVMGRELGLDALRIFSASFSSYDDAADVRRDEILVGQFPLEGQVEGHSWLIGDDVCDTGESFKLAREKLLGMGATIVKSATPFYKPGRSTTGYVPDYFLHETDAWIEFPTERHNSTSPARDKAGAATL